MIELKIAVIIMCAGLKLWGELAWHNAQRFIMPVILGIGIALITGVWWTSFLVLPMIAPLCMGYSVYGKSDGFDRAVWLFLICVAAGLGLLVTHHLVWYFYAPYCVLGAVWGGISRQWLNLVIAPISGALIGSLVCLVR